ncbi:uncharacterized protein LOC131881854 [Tigriopus californicus]|uniref:uncharacterized protein LOC131881854 n=1 Tax=Tigriopus californicus TaxID=6832 RepID=UPI0027DA2C8A|nr:uncharacterized protein LOC131881854 [Tigriopus californicus]
MEHQDDIFAKFELDLNDLASCDDILPKVIRVNQAQAEALETNLYANDVENMNSITWEVPPNTFSLETNPRVRKVGVQRRAGSDSYEVVRGEPIHLQFPRDLFWAEDYIELSLRHCDSRYWHYPENRIHACPKHNLFAERENEEARRYPLKVLEHPSDQMSCRVDLASFMFNMNGLVNKENLVLQFACCGRESHNMGDDSEARTWALHINGTTQGRLFETKLELQVYTTLRNRGDITRKRKLNQSTIKEEVDLDDEEIRIRYKALKQEELERDLKNAPASFLLYVLEKHGRMFSH